MDVKKYLQRINYKGSINTDSSTLRDLCDCHIKTVPFEVLDMFGGKRKVLNLEKIYNDIVINNRGGFCYEINGLLSWLLEELGFQVQILQGQVYNKATHMYGPEFDHLTLMVTFDNGERWLADVGMGSSSFIFPLRFEEMLEQPQRNGVYRLRKPKQGGKTYLVEKVAKQILKENEQETDQVQHVWQTMYQFDTTPRKLSDFEKMCEYQQDSESGFFKYNTIASIHTETGMTNTWGYLVKKHVYIDPYTEKQMIHVAQNDDELTKVWKEEMGLKIDFKVRVQSKGFK